MQKDLKIGLALGLTLVITSVVWLATRPGLQPEARMKPPGDTDTRQQSPEKPAGPAIAKFPSPDSYNGQSDNLNESTVEISNSTAEAGFENEKGSLHDSTIYEQDEKIKTQKFHIILKGNTLSQISQIYYGSAGNWKKILDANRDKIKDPNKIIPGTKLIIPD